MEREHNWYRDGDCICASGKMRKKSKRVAVKTYVEEKEGNDEDQ